MCIYIYYIHIYTYIYIHTYIYIYIYGYIYKQREDDKYEEVEQRETRFLSLYTILSLSILYGVWHIKRGSGGRSYLAQKSHNSIAGVRVVRMGGGNRWMIDSCTHKQVKEYLV